MRRRLLAPPALALATAIALAGCTPPPAEPTAWQGVVQTLASQASGGDYASASATLDQLEADVIAQRDAGAIPATEAEAILSRIAAVRADLASLAPAPEPTPEPAPEPSQESAVDVGSEPTESTVSDDDADEDESPATPDDQPEEQSRPGNEDQGKPGKGDEGRGKSDESPGRGGPGKKDG